MRDTNNVWEIVQFLLEYYTKSQKGSPITKFHKLFLCAKSYCNEEKCLNNDIRKKSPIWPGLCREKVIVF